MKRILILVLLLSACSLSAQQLNRQNNQRKIPIDKQEKSWFSLGLNGGVPFLYDVEMEVIPSFLGKHLGAYAKYGHYSFGLAQSGVRLDGEVRVTGIFDIELPLISEITTQLADAFAQEVLATTKVQISYAEVGIRYYLKKDNSGFYGALGIGQMRTDFKFSDVPVLSAIGDLISQEVSYDDTMHIPQFKIGYRTKTKWYVKAEVGAAFFNLDLPEDINLTNGVDFALFGVSYDYTVDIPNKIPRISDGIILSVGIGTGYRF